MKTRSLIPQPGNAVRTVFFLIAGFFGFMLVGYPIFMYAMGLSTTGIVWITLLILVVAIGILAFMAYLARAYEQDESALAAGEVWAEWTVPVEPYRRFVAVERRGNRRKALAYAVGGVAVGLALGALGDDRLLAGIIIVVFLLAALVTFFLAGPPRDALGEDARRVRIGPRGVHFMGRYLPFQATLTRPRWVSVEPGDPPTIRFGVKSGRRTDQIRVPVATEHVHDAEALAERIRREYDIR